MPYREIVLIASTIKNGRIYFSTADIMFFPRDSYGDRERGGHKGTGSVFFSAPGFTVETYIRAISGKRLSPQKSFASYLKSVGAIEGGRLRITRVTEREYCLEYLGR